MNGLPVSVSRSRAAATGVQSCRADVLSRSTRSPTSSTGAETGTHSPADGVPHRRGTDDGPVLEYTTKRRARLRCARARGDHSTANDSCAGPEPYRRLSRCRARSLPTPEERRVGTGASATLHIKSASSESPRHGARSDGEALVTESARAGLHLYLAVNEAKACDELPRGWNAHLDARRGSARRHRQHEMTVGRRRRHRAMSRRGEVAGARGGRRDSAAISLEDRNVC